MRIMMGQIPIAGNLSVGMNIAKAGIINDHT